MNKDKGGSSFDHDFPLGDNLYELVVVAAQRARQINRFHQLRAPESEVNPIEQALGEARGGRVEYHFTEGQEAEDGEA